MNANNAMPAYKFTFENTLIGWLKQLGIAALYILFGYVIHHNFTSNGIVSVVWWGSGLALGALLIGGRHYLWGVLLGALVVNALANDTLVGALGTTLASILEVLLGVWLLTSNNKFSLSLNTLPDYLRLIVLGGAVASIIGAIIGALALLLAGFITPAGYFGYAFLWWMGDTLGVVLVTPFILAWWQTKSERLNGKQLLEVVLFVGITFIAGQIIFLGWFNERLIFEPKAFMMFLFITWVAIRLGIRPTTFVLNIIAIQALTGAYLNVGYFANEIARSGLHNYWLFMLILSVVGMTMTTYVNEIKQKAFNLRESENHLRLSQIYGGIGTWEADLVTNKQMWSENCVSLLGFPRLSEPRWEDFLAAVHPEDHQRVIDAIQSHIESGKRYEVEYRIVANGDIRWMRSAGQVERDAYGKLTIMRGIVQDVTERKQAEAMLRASEERFRRMANSSPILIWITDATGEPTFINQSWLDFTGLDPAQTMMYEDWISIIHPDDRETASVAYYKNIKVHEAITTEYRLRSANGDWRWILDKSMPLYDESGVFIGYIGSAIDITERKQVQQLLQDKEQILSESQRIAHIGSWSMELATGCISWSDEMYQIYGVTQDTFGHSVKAFLDLIYPGDREAMKMWVSDCLAGKEPQELDFRIMLPDGTIRFIRGSGGLQYDELKRPLRMVGSAQDITERMQAEQVLHQLKAMIDTYKLMRLMQK
jgi:PAS domain S-box-containing protein